MSSKMKSRRTILYLFSFVLALILLYMARPNYLPKGPRVSRIKADLRSMAPVVEAYHTDHGAYPVAVSILNYVYPEGQDVPPGFFEGVTAVNAGYVGSESAGLTTPVAYLTVLFSDAFVPARGVPYAYYTDGSGWIVYSAGPDNDYDLIPAQSYDSKTSQPSPTLLSFSYNPTNGTYSRGDVFRVKD